MRKNNLLIAILGWGWLAAWCGTSPGQTFQELHAFTCIWSDDTGWDCTREGAGPQCALVQGRDGNFYGTTAGGGQWGCGTVFRITPEGELTTLAHFDGRNGCWPYGALLEARDGNFYGTTMYGRGGGNTIRITPAGVITDLSAGVFSADIHPLGDLAEGPDGKLYGAAAGGSIFRFSTNRVFELLHLFSGNDGSSPSGGLLLASDGIFYGVTAGGGAGYGTVYRISTNGEFATLALFPDYPDGAVYPNGRLVEAPDGSLYGTALSPGWVGAVFKVTKAGKLTTIAPSVYQHPRGPLVLANDGNFYGCTYDGGDYPLRGSVFRMTPQGFVTTLFSLTMYSPPYPGAYPYAGLLQGRDGNLYGTTWQGGAGQAGNIFRIIMPGNDCHLTCPTNIAVSNDPGQCGAVVNFGPPITMNCLGYVVTANPRSGSFFPVGTNIVNCTAVDSASSGLTNTCSFQVIVNDCEPPAVRSVTASPAKLWPPNHKMQPVALHVSASDNCGAAHSKIVSVISNEPSPIPGWEITGDLTLNLRAERSGHGTGRVYTITIECTDDFANTSTAMTHVTVLR